MLDRTKHEMTMRNILDDIYSQTELSSLLGFKGGTACYFFYNLPRFSTDLDFNLLNIDKADLIYENLQKLLSKHTTIADKYIKKNTIFFYLVHTEKKSGIKIEISTREIEKINSYSLTEFYGTSLLVMNKEDIFSNKLIALTSRTNPTPRDLFDINYFFSQNWDINEQIIESVTKQTFIDYLSSLSSFIKSNFNYQSVHLGLGELVNNESQRYFIKNKLIDDTTNKINFYVDSYKRNTNEIRAT